MGFFESKKSNETPDRVGGGITATYDDAIKFADNFMTEAVEMAFDKSNTSPTSVLIGTMSALSKAKGLIETIAFIYGKTRKEVESDVLGLAKRRD